MEKQLQDLLESVLKELSDLTKILRGSSKAIQANINTSKIQLRDKKAYIQVLKKAKAKQDELGISTTELSKTITEAEDNLEDFSKQAAKGTGVFTSVIGTVKALGKALLSPATAAIKTGVAFSDVSNPITSMSDAISRGIDDIPVFGTIAKELASDFDAQRESFVQLAKTGASFNGSLARLNNAAAEATIPLPKFVDLIASNSETLGRLFGTVDRGIPQIAGLGARLRSLTENEFAGFGLTLDDTSEFLGTFLELERSRGNIQNLTQAQLIAGTKNYTKQLITLSKLTGKSVDELDKQTKAAAVDGKFRAAIANMDSKRAKDLEIVFGNLSQVGKQALLDVIQFGGAASQSSIELMAASPGAIKAFQDFEKNAGNPDAILNFQNQLGAASQEAVLNGQAFARVATLTGEFEGALNFSAENIRKSVNANALEQTTKRLDDSAKEIVNVFSTFDRISSKAQLARFELLFPTVVSITKGFNKVVGDFFLPGAGFDQFVQSIKEATEKLLGLLQGEDGKGDKTVLGKLSEAIQNGIMKVKEVGGAMGEFFFKGDDNKGFIDNIGLKKDVNPDKEGIQLTNFSKMFDSPKRKPKDMPAVTVPGVMQDPDPVQPKQMQTGSNGFMNFGSGTPAVLHGMESVVPKNDFGQLVKTLREMLPGNNVATAPEPVQSGNLGGDMNRLIDTLSKGNEQVVNSLNNLISVNVTTERNTAKTANTVANMSGSVI